MIVTRDRRSRPSAAPPAAPPPVAALLSAEAGGPVLPAASRAAGGAGGDPCGLLPMICVDASAAAAPASSAAMAFWCGRGVRAPLSVCEKSSGLSLVVNTESESCCEPYCDARISADVAGFARGIERERKARQDGASAHHERTRCHSAPWPRRICGRRIAFARHVFHTPACATDEETHGTRADQGLRLLPSSTCDDEEHFPPDHQPAVFGGEDSCTQAAARMKQSAGTYRRRRTQFYVARATRTEKILVNRKS